MTSQERILAALNGKEADRVPLTEIGIRHSYALEVAREFANY